MPIQNFPAALQPIIQQNMLAREFEEAIRSQLIYRQIADRETFPNSVGETITRTRRGLKAPVTTPLNPANNTNLDNGLTPSGWTVEQYTMTIDMYGDAQDLNTVTQGVGIVRQFVQNARVNGVQAAQSLDRLSRRALFAPYLGGNTRVVTTLGSAGPVVAVDDIRGFQTVHVNGVVVPVSNTNRLAVTVGASAYELIGATPDGSNVSTTPDGISGTLTFSGNVSTGNGTAGNAVTSAVGSNILRPSARATTAALQGTDKLTMGLVLDATTLLRNNNVPTINGLYNCFLDPTSMRHIFSDGEFQLLYRGLGITNNPEFREGMVFETMGARFVVTTEAYQQTHPSNAALRIRRPIVCGQGAIIEGTFEGQAAKDTPANAIIDVIDDIVMVTREPLDRLQQIISQAWYWIGGYAVPTDITANPTIIPTATNSAFKRAVVLETC
jgi:N4-gp56 family major capsid protein